MPCLCYGLTTVDNDTVVGLISGEYLLRKYRSAEYCLTVMFSLAVSHKVSYKPQQNAKYKVMALQIFKCDLCTKLIIIWLGCLQDKGSKNKYKL